MVSSAAWLRFERSHSKYTTNSDVGHAAATGGGGGGGSRPASSGGAAAAEPATRVVTQTKRDRRMLVIGVRASSGTAKRRRLLDRRAVEAGFRRNEITIANVEIELLGQADRNANHRGTQERCLRLGRTRHAVVRNRVQASRAPAPTPSAAQRPAVEIVKPFSIAAGVDVAVHKAVVFAEIIVAVQLAFDTAGAVLKARSRAQMLRQSFSNSVVAAAELKAAVR